MAMKATFALALLLCCASVALATYYEECHDDHDCKSSNQCVTGKCKYGKCKYYNKEDGCDCKDGNKCTVGDKCYNGKCKPGHPLKCTKPGNQCKYAKCNRHTGQCEEYNKKDKTPCKDGDKCTTGDACYYGQCKPGHPLKCGQPKNPCKYAKCDSYSGKCKVYNKADKTPCKDGDKCTVGDVCYYGQCKPGHPLKCSQPKNQCKYAKCDSYSGECKEYNKADESPCRDGDKCTIGDKCYYGVCKPGYQKKCYKGPCYYSKCKANTGKCAYWAKPDGTKCDDKDPKTKNDKCYYGECKGKAYKKSYAYNEYGH